MSKSKHITTTAVFLIGLAAVAWVGWGFVGGPRLALAMTCAIAAVYLIGAHELRQYRQATAALGQALAGLAEPPGSLQPWLSQLPSALREPVRLRIEGERAALPGPALTPYLVGLLVMLGMLGTFLGMVVTFKGAVFALEGSSDLAAIRAALAEPIKGLGLSFGTSVAGVAASAMLGLLSAISRRERLDAVRLLDARIHTALRPFSPAFQREATFQALQTQAQALPRIADQLHALIEGLDRRTDAAHSRLHEEQTRFHAEAQAAYQALALSVGEALKDSLATGARLTGEAIKPVVESAMTGITQAAQHTHAQWMDATQAQLRQLTTQWADTAREVAQAWSAAAERQGQANEALAAGLSGRLEAVTQGLDARTHTLLTSLQEATVQARAQQAEADGARLQAWRASLAEMAETIAADWQRAGSQAVAQQQAACQAMEAAAAQIAERASLHVGETLEGVAQLVGQSEALVRSRVETEAAWTASQGERMAQLTDIWRSELQALRKQEAARGQAAIASLDALQGAVARHLAELGTALEAPMTRLLQTAADVPQAAASVISQLRQEMARLSEQGDQALAERTEMTAQLGGLLRTVNDATQAQRAAIEGLVQSATSVLTQASLRFADALGDQAGKVDAVAAGVAASAVELASLGEAFHHGVDLFSASNDKLVDSLQRIESAIGQSLSRSDEQLAYYVAQAREVIDLSISSQQGIIEDLRRLHASRPASLAAEA